MDDCIFSAAQGDLRELGDGVRRRVRSYNGAIMGVEVDFDEGGVGAPHTHPHTQLTYCLSGEFEFTSGGQKHILRAGDTLLFPAGTEHGCVALKAGRLFDVFTPARQDFLG